MERVLRVASWTERDRAGESVAAMFNRALGGATGDTVVVLDARDRLAFSALADASAALRASPVARVAFSDEDQLDAKSGRYSPRFYPGWDPEAPLGRALIPGFTMFDRALLASLGPFREECEGVELYDLFLRATAAAGEGGVLHVPSVLVHRRAHIAEEETAGASRRVLEQHLACLPIAAGARVLANPRVPGAHRVSWGLPAPPTVSVIVATRDASNFLRTCTDGLLRGTDYDPLEVVLVDNGSTEEAALRLLDELSCDTRVRVIRRPGPFNYSALNNDAVRHALGEVVVLMNNDVEVTDRHWLREMASHAVRPGIGVVGARLLFPDGLVQHAGVVLGVGEFNGGRGVAGHFGAGAAASARGHGDHLAQVRTVSANTAACFAVLRRTWDAVGGLDERRLAVSYNDVDFCLRVRELGLRNVWTPFAELVHHESATRERDNASPEALARSAVEGGYMRTTWGAILDADPFYNPNFSRADAWHRLAMPPRYRSS